MSTEQGKALVNGGTNIYFNNEVAPVDEGAMAAIEKDDVGEWTRSYMLLPPVLGYGWDSH